MPIFFFVVVVYAHLLAKFFWLWTGTFAPDFLSSLLYFASSSFPVGRADPESTDHSGCWPIRVGIGFYRCAVNWTIMVWTTMVVQWFNDCSWSEQSPILVWFDQIGPWNGSCHDSEVQRFCFSFDNTWVSKLLSYNGLKRNWSSDWPLTLWIIKSGEPQNATITAHENVSIEIFQK